MSAVNLDSIYKDIVFGSPSIFAINTVGKWRNDDPTIVRKVVCGAALFASGLAGLVDAVASVALAILTSPLELAGLHFSKSFLGRALCGGVISAMNLTIMHYENLFKNIPLVGR